MLNPLSINAGGINKEIEALARANPDEEVCGIVLSGSVEQIVPQDNISKDKKRHFVLNFKPAAGQKVVGYYHSHPKGGGGISNFDKWISNKLNLKCWVYSFDVGAVELHIPNPEYVPYIGRPYAAGILDCFSLVQDFYKKEYNILIPNLSHSLRGADWNEVVKNPRKYLELYEQDKYFLYDFFINSGFKQTQSPKKGDVILTKFIQNAVTHCSIFWSPGVALDHEYEKPSRFDNFEFKDVFCFLRHGSN